MSRGHAPTTTLVLSAIVAAVAATVALFVPFAGAQSDGCDYVVATGGSDRAQGTAAAPLASVDELLDRLERGEIGCLRSGTYVADQFKLSTPEVKLTSYPGEHATLRGRLRLNAGADGAVVENLLLDGRNPDDLLGPLIYADRVVLRGNEITNHNTAICVHIDDYPGESAPRGVLIENNEIHHCGRLPATNHDHGIYIANARETVIRGNLIYANADRGIQFYPNADDSLVTGNVIDGNGQGVLFGGGSSSSSDRNVVEGNVISNSKIRYNVESYWQGPTGESNLVRRNCVWSASGKYSGSPKGSGVAPSMSGASAGNNLIAEPSYLNLGGGDFSLGPGACGDFVSSSMPKPPAEPIEPSEPAAPPAESSESTPPTAPSEPEVQPSDLAPPVVQPSEPSEPAVAPTEPVADDEPGAAPKPPRKGKRRGKRGRREGRSVTAAKHRGSSCAAAGVSDRLVGTPGRDRLTGGRGRDRIKGHAGNDELGDNGGRDCLIGNAGRDRLYAADGRVDVVRCGRGRDIAVVDRIDRVHGCERTVLR